VLVCTQALAEARAAELAGEVVNDAEHSEQAAAATASAHSMAANGNAADSITAAATAAGAGAAAGASSLAELNMLSADELRAALDTAGLPHQFCLDRGELAFLLHTVQRHGAAATAAAHARLSARRASTGAVASGSGSSTSTLRSSSSTGALRPRQAASWLFGSTGNWSSSSSETSSSTSSSRSPARRLQNHTTAAAAHAHSAAWIEEIHRSSQSASVIETALNEVRQERHRSLLRGGLNTGHEILNWRSLQGHSVASS
jgi:hypothetical protein